MRLLGINRASTPWVIVFVDPKHVDSKRAMAQYKYLAKHYNGTVRFGYVNRRKELLAATFGVTMTPATFLIKEGKVYQYRDFTYADKLAKYINEEGYHNSTNKFS
jgi:thioredoxin-like negative regulator of GroEL